MKRLLLLLLLAVLVSPLSLAQSAEDLFQQATQKERVEGDLQGAIELLERVVDSATDRGLAARALLRIGENYEKLGRDNAADAYQRIVDQFSDQKPEVGVAKNKLNRMSGDVSLSDNDRRAPGTFVTISLDGGDPPGDGWLYGAAISPDGSLVAYTSNDDNRLKITNLNTLETIVPLKPDHYCRDTYTYRFSPDGSRLAFACWINDGSDMALNVLNMSDLSSRMVLSSRDHFGNAANFKEEMEVHDWSESGEQILISVQTFERDPQKPRGEHESAEHLLFVDAKTGKATVIDPDYTNGYRWFRETQACSIQDDRYVLAEYGSEGDSGHIRRFDMLSGEETILIRDKTSAHILFDCLENSNEVLFAKQNLDDSFVLFVAPINEDGEIGERTVVSALEPFTEPLPGARDGSIYFRIEYFRNGVWVSEISDGSAPTATGLDKIHDSWVGTASWSSSGESIFFSRGAGVQIRDENLEIKSEWTGELGIARPLWEADELTLLSSNPWDSGNAYPGTVRYDAKTGAVIDSVSSIVAVAPAKEAGRFYHLKEKGEQECLAEFDFESRDSEVVYCFEDVKPAPGPFLWSASPNGNYLVFWTVPDEKKEANRGRELYLLDMDKLSASRIETPEFDTLAGFGWSADSMTLFKGSRELYRSYSLEDQSWTPWDMNQLTIIDPRDIAVHPDQNKMVLVGRVKQIGGTRVHKVHRPKALN